MLLVFVRSILLYIVVLIGLRAMGKGEIAEMNAFDLVITLLISEVAAVPMGNNDIPLIHGVAAVAGLVFMQILISYLSLKFRFMRVFLSGKPSILINKGNINFEELKKQRVSIDELLEQLRVEGYFKITDVQYAILETDGNLSILPSPSYNSEPCKTFNHLPLSIVIDGNIIKKNLHSLHKDDKWIFDILKSHKIKNIKDVLLLTIDENDKIFIQKR
ncbi:MAG: DUF421 domain-containing protein [Peptostreptococcaceae bacterium]